MDGQAVPLRIFSERGISDEVRDARPYVRYTRTDPSAAKEPFADTSRANRAHITKIANHEPTRPPPGRSASATSARWATPRR